MEVFFIGGCFFNAITCFIFGVIVFLKGKTQKINILCSAMAFSVSLWSLGLGLVVYAKEIHSAEWYLRYVHYLGAICIAPFFLHFILAFLNEEKRHRWIIIGNYCLLFVLQIANFTGVLASVSPKVPFNFYTDSGGWFYILFTVLFAANVVYGECLLFQVFKTEKGKRKEQIKYLLIGLSIGFSGGSTAFFMVFNLNIFPFGVPLAFIYVTCSTYTIIKYRLMNIDLAVRKTFSFLGYIMAAFILIVPLFDLARYHLISAFTLAVPLVAIMPLLFKFVPPYIRKVLDKFLFRGKFGYLEKLDHLWEGKEFQYTSWQIGSKLVYEIVDIMELKGAAFFLYNSSRKAYRPLVELGMGADVKVEPIGTPDWAPESDFVRRLSSMGKPFWKEDPCDTADAVVIGEIARTWEAEMVLPLFFEDRLIGFLMLRDKCAGEMFHYEDVKVLIRQVNIAETHLTHAIFMEERASFSRKLAHDIKNTFNKAVVPTIMDLKTPEDARVNKESIVDRLVAQLTFLQEVLNQNFNLVSMLEQVIKRNYQKKPGDLGKVIWDAVAVFQSAYDHRGLEINIDIGKTLPTTAINREDMSKVFHNLLDNALKFMDRGGVTIKTEVTDTCILIAFSDTGVGLNKEKLENLFEAKVVMPDEKGAGSGLGLTIVKDVIEAHGGTILAESERWKGITFTMTLPLPEYPLKPDGPRILIVDDDASIVQSRERILTKKGYHVYKAYDGEQGWNILKREKPFDLLILDLDMPKLTGDELLKRIKDDPMAAALKILVITGMADPGLSEKEEYKKHPIVMAATLGPTKRGWDGKFRLFKVEQWDTRMPFDGALGGGQFLEMVESMLEQEPEPIDCLRKEGEPWRILIVEDNRSIREQIKKKLEKEDMYEVLSAEDGKVALEVLSRDPVDLVILDIEMPHTKGDEVLKVMSSNFILRDIPVIIHTSVTDWSAPGEESLRRRIKNIGTVSMTYEKKKDNIVTRAFKTDTISLLLNDVTKLLIQRHTMGYGYLKKPITLFQNKARTAWMPGAMEYYQPVDIRLIAFRDMPSYICEHCFMERAKDDAFKNSYEYNPRRLPPAKRFNIKLKRNILICPGCVESLKEKYSQFGRYAVNYQGDMDVTEEKPN